MGMNPPRYSPHRHGPIKTVAMAHWSGRPLWAFCRNCAHVRTVDTWKLVSTTSTGDASLEAAAKRFSCRNCRQRVTILIPAQGLAHE